MIVKDPGYFRQQARRCRELAAWSLDKRVAASMRAMAAEYDLKAEAAESFSVKRVARSEGKERV